MADESTEIVVDVQQPAGSGNGGGFSSGLLVEEDEDGQTIAEGLQLDGSWKVLTLDRPAALSSMRCANQ